MLERTKSLSKAKMPRLTLCGHIFPLVASGEIIVNGQLIRIRNDLHLVFLGIFHQTAIGPPNRGIVPHVIGDQALTLRQRCHILRVPALFDGEKDLRGLGVPP